MRESTASPKGPLVIAIDALCRPKEVSPNGSAPSPASCALSLPSPLSSIGSLSPLPNLQTSGHSASSLSSPVTAAQTKGDLPTLTEAEVVEQCITGGGGERAYQTPSYDPGMNMKPQMNFYNNQTSANTGASQTSDIPFPASLGLPQTSSSCQGNQVYNGFQADFYPQQAHFNTGTQSAF